ncbi:hypothetical protein JCM10908_004540 [Rhodotorula pacifica]|uniref:uncharacterized protein n=1 Tax=Rhodotorula pacifica TaxID=1495444 RepID=UPI0031798930
MVAVFHPETPSRVLRRIDDLNQLSLPDLPDLPAELPSFSETTDAESTVAYSPAKGNATPAPPRGGADDRENRDPLVDDGQQTPYTSTPAPSSVLYARSDATVIPQSAQSRAANDTTATLRAPLPQGRAPPAAASDHSYDEQLGTASENEEEGGTGFQDEMVLMSSGSGDEEEEDRQDGPQASQDKVELRHAPVPSMELSALPEVRPDDETTADSDDVTRHSRTRAYRSAVREEEVEVPATVKKPSTREAAEEHRLLPDSLSPLRDREPTEGSIESVELGRHASPQTSPHASLRQYDTDATPSRAFSKSPSPAFQPETPRLDSPLASIRNETALSTPRVDQSAAQRRAAHVLTTLRSTAKPRLARGTPHPVRTASKRPITADDDEQASVSSIASDRSSNDLTTFHKGNTSLPSGGSAAAEIGPGGSRFDGAKLNSYLHALNTQLTDENQSLVQTLQKTAREKELLQAETRRLEDTIREMSVTQGAISFDASARDRTRADDSSFRDEVDTLKAQLDATATERDALRSELAKLDGAFPAADSSLAQRSDLLAELEQKDAELESVRKQMEDQEAEFAQKMEDLERELCKVMEEQEAKVEQARREVEEQRREDEAERQADRERIRRLEAERDELERRTGGGEEDGDPNGGNDDRDALHQQIATLDALVSDLRSDVENRDDELVKMQEELDTAEERIAELEAQLSKPNGDVSGDVAVLQQQIAQKDEEIKQLEDALDDSAQQLVDNETVLADKDAAVTSLRTELAAEQEKRVSLEARLSQLSVPKAKSPLANEVYNGANEEQIAALEEELDVARRDADDLRKKLAEVGERERLAKLHELEVQKLEADKADLEDRVKSLRQQVSSPYSPNKTPDKSWGLRPLPAVFTPRTPGQIFGNLSTWSNGNAADETISPLLAQIHELEQVVDHLQAQLGEANVAIDSKLNKLEAAGSSTISLARQLSDARARIAQLEDDLERLLGHGGSLERVQARLAKLTCPECKSKLDANRIVRLRIDRSGITFAEDTPSSSSTDEGVSLKASLAKATARIEELQVENQVLEASVAHATEVTAEKEKLVRQREELDRHLKLLRDEMTVLETDLRTERSRLRNLTSEQTLAGKARAALEARLATAEAELRDVKRELASAASPAELDRLRAEKAQLQDERTNLLRQLAEVKAHASQVVSELSASRADDSALRQQLERHVQEIRHLREDSHAKDAEKRRLQDERNDILRGVANLQADLNRVRQEVITLGLEIAAVRKERDDLSKRNKGDDDELVRAAHQLALAQAKISELQSGLNAQSPSTSEGVAALQAKHKSEMKGLLVLSRQLKLRLEREAAFRYQAGMQKRYLEDVLRGKQATIDTVFSHLHIAPPGSSEGGRKSLRAVVLSVIATKRMARLASEWRERSAPKKRLREKAYPAARGRPFPE